MKTRKLGLFSMFVSALIILSACGMDGSSSELIGTWESVDGGGTLELRKDSSYIMDDSGRGGGGFHAETNWRKLDDNRIETGIGILEYTISGNQLTLVDPSGEPYVYRRQGEPSSSAAATNPLLPPLPGVSQPDANQPLTGDSNTPSTKLLVRPFTIERVSVASDGSEGDESSQLPTISSSGRFIAFHSSATNLTDEEIVDSHGIVFLHNRETGETTSREFGGVSTPFISDDGKMTVYSGFPVVKSEQNLDIDSDAVEFFSGNWVNAIENSKTNNIVIQEGLDGPATAYSLGNLLHETENSPNATIRDEALKLLPYISSDGRFVALNANYLFRAQPRSYAILYDSANGTTKPISILPEEDGKITQSGSYTHLVPISADGQYALFGASRSVPRFWTDGSSLGYENVFNSFIRDLKSSSTEVIDLRVEGEEISGGGLPSISADGRFIAAVVNIAGARSGISSLQIVVYDRQTGLTEIVSTAEDQTLGNANSSNPQISADGGFIAFESLANNFVTGDTNGKQDVFVAENPHLVKE